MFVPPDGLSKMMQQPEGSPSRNDPMGNVPKIVWQLIRCAAMSVLVFIHVKMGKRSLRLFNQFWTSITLGIGFVAASAYTSLFANTNAEILGWFFLGSMGMAAVQTWEMHTRDKQGKHIYSYYDGTPRLKALLPFLREYHIKRYIEPTAVFILGWVVMNTLNPPLGAWLCIAAFSMAALNEREKVMWENRILDLQDAGLLNKWLSEDLTGKDASEIDGIETWNATHTRFDDARAESNAQPAPAMPDEEETGDETLAARAEIASRLTSDLRSQLNRFNDDADLAAAQPAANDNPQTSESGANGKRPVGRPRKYHDSASV